MLPLGGANRWGSLRQIVRNSKRQTKEVGKQPMPLSATCHPTQALIGNVEIRLWRRRLDIVATGG